MSVIFWLGDSIREAPQTLLGEPPLDALNLLEVRGGRRCRQTSWIEHGVTP